MTRPGPLLLFILGLPMTCLAAGPLRLYVQPDGDNAWSGHSPEHQGREGPFATLERARDEIRAQRKIGRLPVEGAIIELGAGLYELSSPVRFGSEDSGTLGGEIVVTSRPGAEVRLSGGKKVTNFVPITDADGLKHLEAAARGHVLQADLRALGIRDLGDPAADGKHLELFFRDRPMTVARWPDEGYARIEDVAGDTAGRFVYQGRRPERWIDEKSAWLHGYWFWDWAEDRERIESIDVVRHSITLAQPHHGYGYRQGARWYAFNLLSELDRPGEYYLDSQKGILYFWPPQPLRQGNATVSVTRHLIEIVGASHLSFRGLILEASRDTPIIIDQADSVHVRACTLRNTGGWGVRIAGVNSGVDSCDIYGTGGGGVWLSGGERASLKVSGLVAENNHIHAYARWKPMYQPAIQLLGVGGLARNNLIHDAPHMAVGFSGNDHRIEYNEIHDVCKESNDAGAIYAGRSWADRGTVIRHNHLHDLSGLEGRGCVGVYLDDQFSGTQVYGNVFQRVATAVMIGGGRDCTVENNIFLHCTLAIHVDSRGLRKPGWFERMNASLAKVPYQQGLWAARYPSLAGILDDDPMAPKGNLIARNICVGGRWDKFDSQAYPLLTLKGNYVEGDPRFVDAQKLDLRLKDDSPALKLGFRPLPLLRAGLVADKARAGRDATRDP